MGNPGESITEFLPNGTRKEEKEEGVKAFVNTQSSSQDLVTTTPAQTTSKPILEDASVGVLPRARLRMRDGGVNLPNISGTGPTGRILERDVIAALTSPFTFH
ncbi:MAG: E3 binding domain-containing protein [Trueperaceae bacterium]